MNQEPHFIPYRCGKNAEEWLAELGPLGAKYGFVAFRQAQRAVPPEPAAERTNFAQRLRDLLVQPAPLPPPQNAELVSRQRARELTDQDITEYGFKCPTCGNTKLTLCPACNKSSCGGGEQDSAGRFLCQWCGTTLVYRALTDQERNEPKAAVQIDTTSPRTELRFRELPPGTRP